MRLELLRIVHLRKGGSLPAGVLGSYALNEALPGAFTMDSCLRKLWICDEALIREHGIPAELDSAEVLSGYEAYSFLLRVACGLESQIAGETDIFGQVKEAWKCADRVSSDVKGSLAPWMQRLFEDTKEIRSLHLQNLGGASYGSLVRMILARLPEKSRGPVLLIGAGQLAQSVAPYLLETELWISNRSRESLENLREDLVKRAPAAREKLLMISPAEVEQAWKKAAQVVICIPPSAQDDARRMELWKAGGASRPVIHLGALREHAGEWVSMPEFHSLTEVFELDRAQGQLRSAQIARARRACDEKAKLRLLGGSASLPHGWEDLAVFA